MIIKKFKVTVCGYKGEIVVRFLPLANFKKETLHNLLLNRKNFKSLTTMHIHITQTINLTQTKTIIFEVIELFKLPAI